MTINKLNGTECGTEIAKKINDIIDEKASVSLDNLDTDGQAILDGKVNSSDLFDENEHIKINKLQSYSLPSGRYINLTLGASGTSYVAPADGYYYLCKDSTQAGQYIQLDGTFTIMSSAVWAHQWCYVYMFARKGQTIIVSYNNGGNTIAFKFIYAVGSAPA